MKNLKQTILLLSAVTMLFTISSCKKEKVKGCMDKDSKNYNAAAEEDDASCAYEGSIVFWQSEANAQALIDGGSTALTYYIDGAIVGSSAASIFFKGGSPDCGNSAAVTAKKDLGKTKTKASTFKVIDQDNDVIYSGNVTFTANTCLALELIQ
jgi:hypothetical protein